VVEAWTYQRQVKKTEPLLYQQEHMKYPMDQYISGATRQKFKQTNSRPHRNSANGKYNSKEVIDMVNKEDN
jgi:hypothetical protein